MSKKLLWVIGIVVVVVVLGSLFDEEEKNAQEKSDTEIDSKVKKGGEEKSTKRDNPPSNAGPSISDPWVKSGENPVLREQPASHWFQLIGDPSVLIDQGTYKMWFGANTRNGKTSVGYATSSNGRDWNLHEKPVLMHGSEGAWNDFTAETPNVIKNADGKYEMWFTGAGAAPEDDNEAWEDRTHKIGYATSSDGVNWVARKDPVMVADLSKPQEWDFLSKADPMVIKENGLYKMWYSGAGVNDKQQQIIQIGYATSSDGVNWDFYENNPVLSLGLRGSWDAGSVSTPTVFHDGSVYVMLYTGLQVPESGVETGSLGCATSKDGITWNRNSKPCLTKGGSGKFDSSGLWGPTGLYHNGAYEVWYSALELSDDIHVNVGHARLASDE